MKVYRWHLGTDTTHSVRLSETDWGGKEGDNPLRRRRRGERKEKTRPCISLHFCTAHVLLQKHPPINQVVLLPADIPCQIFYKWSDFIPPPSAAASGLFGYAIARGSHVILTVIPPFLSCQEETFEFNNNALFAVIFHKLIHEQRLAHADYIAALPWEEKNIKQLKVGRMSLQSLLNTFVVCTAKDAAGGVETDVKCVSNSPSTVDWCHIDSYISKQLHNDLFFLSW